MERRGVQRPPPGGAARDVADRGTAPAPSGRPPASPDARRWLREAAGALAVTAGVQSRRVARGVAWRGREGAAWTGRAVRIARHARAEYGASTTRLATRVAALRLRRGFRLEEAHAIGLLDPALGAAALDAHVSKRHLLRAQRRLNPNEMSHWTEDKAVFYRHAEAAGIPVPRLYGVLCESGPGWSWRGEVLAGPADWARFMIESVPDEFVVKPSRGYHGLDVRVVRREGPVLVHAGGERLSAPQLCAAILADRRFHSHVVQERLRDHPGMPGDGEALQTVRMVTLVERGGGVGLLNAQLKVARPGAAVDNFQDGATGNLIAPVRLGDGAITALIGADRHGVMREVAPAPADGLPAPGARLPLWEDALALVRRAAPVFLPMRCVGWDVALTPGGPVIVEGNMWWDPPSPEPTAGGIARHLRHA